MLHERILDLSVLTSNKINLTKYIKNKPLLPKKKEEYSNNNFLKFINTLLIYL